MLPVPSTLPLHAVLRGQGHAPGITNTFWLPDACLTLAQVHIAPYAACEGLFRGAAAALPPGGPLCLYGPFLRGRGDAPSNLGFDCMLRRHDLAWGVRALARVQATAAERGLEMQEAVDMPSNNLLLVFRPRTADA